MSTGNKQQTTFRNDGNTLNCTVVMIVNSRNSLKSIEFLILAMGEFYGMQLYLSKTFFFFKDHSSLLLFKF